MPTSTVTAELREAVLEAGYRQLLRHGLGTGSGGAGLADALAEVNRQRSGQGLKAYSTGSVYYRAFVDAADFRVQVLTRAASHWDPGPIDAFARAVDANLARLAQDGLDTPARRDAALTGFCQQWAQIDFELHIGDPHRQLFHTIYTLTAPAGPNPDPALETVRAAALTTQEAGITQIARLYQSVGERLGYRPRVDTTWDTLAEALWIAAAGAALHHRHHRPDHSSPAGTGSAPSDGLAAVATALTRHSLDPAP